MTKQALDKMINGTLSERLYLAEQSFGLFCIYYFSEHFKYKLAPYQKDFIKDVEDLDKGVIKELVWIGFRECAKTTYAQLALLWFIAFKKRNYMNVDSYSGENSQRSLFDIASWLLNNARLRADFGELYTRNRTGNEMKQNKVNNFTTENGLRLEASTTQIDVRGRKHGTHRPDFRWCDDFETHETKDSSITTTKIRNNFTSAMGGMESNGVRLYTANYLTEHGNVQWLLDRAKENPMIRVRNIPVIINDAPAWPSKYCMTDEEAKVTGKVSIEAKRKELGHYVFSYEMMNEPIDEALAEFKKEWLQRADEEQLKHIQYNTFIAIDPAVSQKESADFTGITVNRVSRDGKRYISAYKLKINTAELIEHIFYLQDTYKPTIIGMEETAFTIAIQPFLQQEMRKRNKFVSLKPLKHGGIKKETRIRGLIPLMESKSVFLVGDCSALEEEMRTFPHGQHDDCLDSLVYSEMIAYKPHDTSVLDDIEEEKMLYPDIGL